MSAPLNSILSELRRLLPNLAAIRGYVRELPQPLDPVVHDYLNAHAPGWDIHQLKRSERWETRTVTTHASGDALTLMRFNLQHTYNDLLWGDPNSLNIVHGCIITLLLRAQSASYLSKPVHLIPPPDVPLGAIGTHSARWDAFDRFEHMSSREDVLEAPLPPIACWGIWRRKPPHYAAYKEEDGTLYHAQCADLTLAWFQDQPEPLVAPCALDYIRALDWYAHSEDFCDFNGFPPEGSKPVPETRRDFRDV